MLGLTIFSAQICIKWLGLGSYKLRCSVLLGLRISSAYYNLSILDLVALFRILSGACHQLMCYNKLTLAIQWVVRSARFLARLPLSCQSCRKMLAGFLEEFPFSKRSSFLRGPKNGVRMGSVKNEVANFNWRYMMS